MRCNSSFARHMARWAVGALAILLPAVASAQVTSTWTGGGTDNNWGTAGNWSSGVPVSGGSTVLVFSGSTRTASNNNLGDWNLSIGRLQFASGAASFTLGGNTFGFDPYLGSQAQQIFQNSANTQTISVGGFSFRNGSDSQINLNAGDLAISSPNMYIDANGSATRQFYVTGTDATRRTVTFSGNVNKDSSGNDPDMVIQNNKRALVTGSLTFGSGNDGSVFVNDGVLQFSGAGTMTGGAPVIGDTSGSANAALRLDTAGATFARQIEIRGGSSGQRIVGGLNTSGTVTFSGNVVATNSPSDYDLKAASSGAANFSGTRNFNAGLRVNRADADGTYGGTVILSGTTNSTSWTALHAGTLQFDNFNQLGTDSFEFNADSGDSGTLRYTGGSTTTTKTLWIDNPGITRAAIDVSQPGTTLTWNPGSGAVNQNLTKAGAGVLQFGGGITGTATVGVEVGTLILTGSSSYTGGTVVSGGTLEVSAGGSQGGSAAALGTGTVSIASGGQVKYWLSLFGSSTVANPFALSGGTLHTTDGYNTYSGRVTLASGSSTISAQYEDVITLSGGLAGNGNVLFTQSGGTGSWAAPTYVLSGTGANTGTVRVSGSSGGGATKLQLANVNALQSATLDLATADIGTVEFTVAGNNTYALGGLQGSRNLAFGGNSLSVGGNDQNTTYSGGLTGSGLFTKLGSGTLTLSGSNTISGGMLVTGTAGTLAIANAAALGSGTVTMQMQTTLGGTSWNIGLNLTNGMTVANPIVMSQSLNYRNIIQTTGTTQLSGPITITGSGNGINAISVTNGPLTLSGNLTGTSAFTGSVSFRGNIAVTGTIAMSGAGFDLNTGGTTTVSSTGNVWNFTTFQASNNVLQLGANNALPTTASMRISGSTTGGGLDLNGYSQSVAGILMSSGGTPAARIYSSGSGTSTLTFAGLGSGPFSVAAAIVDGTGGGKVAIVMNSAGRTQTLASATSSYSGGTTILSGTLAQGATNALGSPSGPLALNGGTLDLGGYGLTVGPLTGSAGGVVTSGTSGAVNFTASSASDSTFGGTIQDGSGTVAFTKSGGGTLTLTGTSTYGGATSITGGGLSIGSVGQLPNTSGVSIAGGAGLAYTGGTATFGKNITVTSGTGSVTNTGGGLLTLSGTLSKNGTVLQLAGGAFNVTGAIVGSNSNSDLVVAGTSSVTLSAANTYNGPTFVIESSALTYGINNAIPSNSVVTLGNASSQGTLAMNGSTGAIGGLAFGSGGGTLRLAATSTSAAPLTAATGTMTLTNGTLDLAGSGSTAGLYRVLSAQSIGGSFASITGTSAAYQVITSATSVDYQQRAVLGGVTVTNPAVSIITGGSAAFTYTVANSALSGGASLGFSSGSLSANLVGSSSGTAAAGGPSASISGLVFTGTSVGSNQQGTFAVSAPTAYGATTATGTVAVTVLDHATSSLASGSTALSTVLNLGTWDYKLNAWTSGTSAGQFSISNLASSFGASLTADLSLLSVSGTGNGFTTNLNTYTDIAGGSSRQYSVFVDPTSFLTSGTQSWTFTIAMGDKTGLSGGLASNTLSVTANVAVVPEPSTWAMALAAIGCGGWMVRRRRRDAR